MYGWATFIKGAKAILIVNFFTAKRLELRAGADLYFPNPYLIVKILNTKKYNRDK